MDYSIVIYIIGWILELTAAFLLLPTFTALIYQEPAGLAFFLSSAICLLAGLPLLVRGHPKKKIFHLREGYIAVALSWIVLSLAGALPFLLSGTTSNPVDALFESVSGFTTTGASVFSEIETLPRCILMWRCFSQWIGGMGVLVFLLTLIPLAGGSNMNLMKAESPGPTVSRLMPKVKSSAKILYTIYLVMTTAELVLLLLGRMPLFDALTTAFATAGTGGFGVRTTSIAEYSGYIQSVIVVFMILFGVNFSVYFLLLTKKWRQSLANTELRAYLGLIVISIGIITLNLRPTVSGFGKAFRLAAFQVASIISTTGYTTTDFAQWPQTSCAVLLMLMFVGGCAGSTSCAIKVSRFIIMLKTVRKELHTYLHPRSVKIIQMNGKPVEHDVIRSTNVFLITYIMIFVCSMFLLTLENHGFLTTFTAVAASLNNIGPGFGLVGPTQSYVFFSNPSKLVLIFDMLAGRLELFPILLLFVPSTWKKF